MLCQASVERELKSQKSKLDELQAERDELDVECKRVRSLFVGETKEEMEAQGRFAETQETCRIQAQLQQRKVPPADGNDVVGESIIEDDKVEMLVGKLATLEISNMNPSESSIIDDHPVQECAPNAVDEGLGLKELVERKLKKLAAKKDELKDQNEKLLRSSLDDARDKESLKHKMEKLQTEKDELSVSTELQRRTD